uniref:Uncharacterized protein n=1 Tax=Vespula pensylvanica TaxID=30213 RepID=A0A834JYI6_VESPE|nr:hypothetical protein H0235_016390 [Vespula pensylvanica]
MEFSCHQEDRSTWSRSLSRIVVARAAKRRGALHLSHNHLESDPLLGSDSASGARPTNPRASKIAYLREAAAFASKSLGGGVNNGRATFALSVVRKQGLSNPIEEFLSADRSCLEKERKTSFESDISDRESDGKRVDA